jgi:uncharacterized surface protein with fasciclin (FAS1) repeats
MTSSGPYTQSHNMTHMWDFTDLCGNLPKQHICTTNLYGIIKNNINFSKFKYILKLAKLDNILNDPQANFTLFVPTDKALNNISDGVFTNMDSSVARHIIKSSMLERKITSDILENSPACNFITKDPPNKLFITNMNGKTYINNCIQIIEKDIDANNGIIHTIDGLIWPNMI